MSRIVRLLIGSVVAVVTATAVEQVCAVTWTAANPGNFLDPANWGGTVPNGVDAVATIGTQPTTAGSFTLNGAMTVRTLTTSNALSRAISGSGTLTFQVSSGTALLDNPNVGLVPQVSSVVLASTTELRVSGIGINFSAAVSGPGGIIKTGNGQVILPNSNSYSGLNDVRAGNLTGHSIANLGTNSAFGRGNFAVSNNAVLQIEGPSTTTDRTFTMGIGGGQVNIPSAATTIGVTGLVDGVGGLTKRGAGALTLSSTNNSYAGPTTINGGVLSGSYMSNAGNNTSFGAGSSFTISGGGALQYTGGGNITNRSLGLGTGGGGIEVTSASAGVFWLGAVGGVGGLKKSGAGRLELYAANDYSGGTIITSGTLLANNSTGSGTGSGPVAVQGGTLGGGGTIAGDVSFAAAGNATLAPGASTGTLTLLGDLTLDPTTSLSFELNGADLSVGGGINDLANVAGDLALNGYLSLIETIPGSFAMAPAGSTWRLINYGGTLSGGGISLGSMPSLAPGLAYYVDTSIAGQVNLLITTAVPEAGAWMMLTVFAAAASLGAFCRACRRVSA